MPRDYRGTEHQLCVTEYSQWLGGQGLERVRRLVVLFGLWVRGARLPLRALIWVGFLNYPAPRVDHRFKDGDTIRLGPIALTALLIVLILCLHQACK
jgi:hypothetical protein